MIGSKPCAEGTWVKTVPPSTGITKDLKQKKMVSKLSTISKYFFFIVVKYLHCFATDTTIQDF